MKKLRFAICSTVFLISGLEAIFKEVWKLREELKEVKAILKQSRSLGTASIPSDIPVVLPLKDGENFLLLEEYLSSNEKLNDLVRIYFYIKIHQNSTLFLIKIF